LTLETAPAAAANPPYLEWTREQRTSARDTANDVAADSLGNIFVTGETLGPLSGSSLGAGDAFLTRYDSTGDRKWTINIGSNKNDVGYGVSTDNFGNAYVAGGINGSYGLVDQATADAFVRKYDVNGNLTWARIFGTSTTDEARDVVGDALGNVFVAGLTLGNLAGTNAGNADVFVSKFNSQGDLLWSRQIGSTQFDGAAVAATDGLGNVYVAGSTTGSFGGPNSSTAEDMFVAKFDPSGNHLWTHQFGNQGQQFGDGMIVDATGNVYIAGTTSGSWGGPAGGDGNATNPYDGFLIKLDSNGDQRWLRQFGGHSYDSAGAVTIDLVGNVYVAGHSNSNLPGTDADGSDAFVLKFTPAGYLQWTTQAGPHGPDEGYAVASDGGGNLYTAGSVFRGSMFTPEDYDVFAAKISLVPEPTSLTLLSPALICTTVLRRSRSDRSRSSKNPKTRSRTRGLPSPRRATPRYLHRILLR
jgi:hypothetical protein